MTTADERAMRKAIEAAATARALVAPRPWVGAFVLPVGGAPRDGYSGATDGRAGAHAEVMALAEAGDDARDATLYVTLEPCAHHGVTPPCVDAVIAAGIRRVVVGITDPDPRVAGAGIVGLRAAGLTVDVGVCAHEVEAQLAPYLHHRRTGRPYVVLKLAATLDGRTAAPDGSSQWITSATARTDVHRLRAESDAIVVGSGTVVADDPQLTLRLDDERLPDHRDPIRIVLGDIPAGARVLPARPYHGELGELLDELGAEGVLQVLVEGGATVAHSFHHAGLVDRYAIYLAPALFGGDDGRPLFAGPGAASIDGVWRGAIDGMRRLGPDLRIDVVAVPEEGR